MGNSSSLEHRWSGRRVVICCSRKDHRWLKQLRMQLKPLERQGMDVWDESMAVGRPWKEEIEAALASASVAVLLISKDFLASDLVGHLPALLERARRGDVVTFCLYLSAALVEEVPGLSEYAPFNPPEEGLMGLPAAEQEATLARLARHIKQEMERQNGPASDPGRHPRSEEAHSADRAPSPKASIDIHVLVETCRRSSADEIRERVGRKYIQALYISREPERTLENLLIADDSVVHRLTAFRESATQIIARRTQMLTEELAKLREREDLLVLWRKEYQARDLYVRAATGPKETIEKALEALTSAHQLTKQARLLIWMGRAHQRLDQAQEALRCYEQCVREGGSFGRQDWEQVAAYLADLLGSIEERPGATARRAGGPVRRSLRKKIEACREHVNRLADLEPAGESADRLGLSVAQDRAMTEKNRDELERDKLKSRIEEMEELAPERANRKKHIQDTLSALDLMLPEIDAVLDQCLEDSRPCDARHRPRFGKLAQHLEDSRDLFGTDWTELATAKGLLAELAGNAALIIDRAGGGKTNLLCQLATQAAINRPVLFLTARFPIESRRSLHLLLLKRAGWDGVQDPDAFMEEVDSVLRRHRSFMTVLIDGINENRSVASISANLDHAIERLERYRVRFIVTCRDIYWSFFSSSSWVRSVCSRITGELYQFSPREQELALKVYLDNFHIIADLGPNAAERCRHPLLLRFLCEAYQGEDDAPTLLGRVEEIRLKPLFDDYWQRKLGDIRRRVASLPIDEVVLRLAHRMFHTSVASVKVHELPQVVGLNDTSSEESAYIQLLDEDIIIDELPDNDLAPEPNRTGISAIDRRVIFVYEEFMEYTIARGITTRWMKDPEYTVSSLFADLRSKKGTFVNVLGIAEYIAGFWLSDGLFDTAFQLLCLMADVGEEWSQVVCNVFAKYSETLQMMTAIDTVHGLMDPHHLRVILECLRTGARQFLVEACVALGLRVALPEVFPIRVVLERPATEKSERVPEKTMHGQRMLSECMLNADYDLARRILKEIASALRAARVNNLRGGIWAAWSTGQPIAHDPSGEQRAHLISALCGSLGGAPRREALLLYACNGCFDRVAQIRREVRGYFNELGHLLPARLKDDVRQVTC